MSGRRSSRRAAATSPQRLGRQAPQDIAPTTSTSGTKLVLESEPSTRLEAWEHVWDRLPGAQQRPLLPALAKAVLSLESVSGDEWFLQRDLLPDTALWALWQRSGATLAQRCWLPLPLLRRLAGPEAVLAWVRGVTGALAWFEVDLAT